MPRENSRPGFPWAAASASMDVVPFLKALLRLLSILLRAPGENPRFSDRAAALCVVFFLKTPPWSSRYVSLLRLGDGGLVSSPCFLRQSLLLGLHPWPLVWTSLGDLGLWAVLAGSWWWSASGGVACAGGVASTAWRVRWFVLWVNSGPTLLPVQLLLLFFVASVMAAPAVRASGCSLR
jgi:hypothetical protein